MAAELAEYLRSCPWLDGYAIEADENRVHIARRAAVTVRVYNNLITYQFQYSYYYSMNHVLAAVVMGVGLGTRKRKQCAAEFLAKESGVEYAALNSWRDRYTVVVFTRGDLVTHATFGRRHFMTEHTSHAYRIFKYSEHNIPKIIPWDVPHMTARNRINKIQKNIEEYEKELPLLSKKYELKIRHGEYFVAGFSLGRKKLNFNKLQPHEARLTRIEVIKSLPQPIAEEIAPHML